MNVVHCDLKWKIWNYTVVFQSWAWRSKPLLCVVLKSADVFLKVSNSKSSCAFYNASSWESRLNIRLSGVAWWDPDVRSKAQKALFVKMADGKCNSTRIRELGWTKGVVIYKIRPFRMLSHKRRAGLSLSSFHVLAPGVDQKWRYSVSQTCTPQMQTTDYFKMCTKQNKTLSSSLLLFLNCLQKIQRKRKTKRNSKHLVFMPEYNWDTIDNPFHSRHTLNFVVSR